MISTNQSALYDMMKVQVYFPGSIILAGTGL
jgi:hypothetical protein